MPNTLNKAENLYAALDKPIIIRLNSPISVEYNTQIPKINFLYSFCHSGLDPESISLDLETRLRDAKITCVSVEYTNSHAILKFRHLGETGFAHPSDKEKFLEGLERFRALISPDACVTHQTKWWLTGGGATVYLKVLALATTRARFVPT